MIESGVLESVASVRMPHAHYVAMVAHAKANDRVLGAEIRRAIRFYLAECDPTADIPSSPVESFLPQGGLNPNG